MTFELHRKQLGQIAYSPKAVAYCHEPHSLSDYTSQIKRWHLGFWQTVLRHGLWKSRFSLSLLIFILESLIISCAFIALPFFALTTLTPMFHTSATAPFETDAATQIAIGLLLFLALDMLSTIVVAWLTRKPALIWHGLFFIVLRWVDSVYFILTLPMAFFVKSNGRWTSPIRQASG